MRGDPGFWRRFANAYFEVNGVLGTLFTVILSFLVWKLANGATIDVWLAAATWAIAFVLVVVLARMCLKLLSEVAPSATKVLRVVSEDIPETGASIVCLLSPSPLLSHDSLVAFYVVDETGYERQIGTGKVINVQANGMIQALLWAVNAAAETDVEKLLHNDPLIIGRTMVKISAPGSHLAKALHSAEVENKRMIETKEVD